MPSTNCRRFCMLHKRAILGIDPAWTATEPSGVALVANDGIRWRCIALAPSYDAFSELADGKQIIWSQPESFSAGKPSADKILDAAGKLLNGCQVEIITIDMPVATVPFTTRRPADRAISRAFGRHKCATHSPTSQRPGEIGRQIHDGFTRNGFELATTATTATTSVTANTLLEVYPHTALLRLLHRDERFPYKVAKSSKYWPGTGLSERRAMLLGNFQTILAALGKYITDIDLPLPSPSEGGTLSSLKRLEDAIDALICAWVGICYLNEAAEPFGDESAAIWVPKTVYK